jgi:hypothetical protein
MADESEHEARCTCPPGSYGLGCEIHWEIVAAALEREVAKHGTTTRNAVANPDAPAPWERGSTDA